MYCSFSNFLNIYRTVSYIYCTFLVRDKANLTGVFRDIKVARWPIPMAMVSVRLFTLYQLPSGQVGGVSRNTCYM
jgi:hypothetical protein